MAGSINEIPEDYRIYACVWMTVCLVIDAELRLAVDWLKGCPAKSSIIRRVSPDSAPSSTSSPPPTQDILLLSAAEQLSVTSLSLFPSYSDSRSRLSSCWVWLCCCWWLLQLWTPHWSVHGDGGIGGVCCSSLHQEHWSHTATLWAWVASRHQWQWWLWSSVFSKSPAEKAYRQGAITTGNILPLIFFSARRFLYPKERKRERERERGNEKRFFFLSFSCALSRKIVCWW